MSDSRPGAVPQTFAQVLLPATGRVVDLVVADGRIARLDPATGPAREIALPPLVDLHLHAARENGGAARPPRDFGDAVAQVMTEAETGTEHDAAAHAGRIFDRLIRKGTARARTHADVGGPFGWKPLLGTLAAAGAVRERLEVEVVALVAPFERPSTPDGAARLRDAHRAGAALLGGVPAFDPEPEACIDALLDLALELGCGVDLHLDEHLDPARCHAVHLAAATKARGLAGRVTLSHGCAIGMLPPDTRRRTADALAEAGVVLVSLPSTNLYLQDRAPGGFPMRRGLAPVRELLDAGVAVRFASDNLRDAFYPYGSGDLLEIALLAAITTHVEDPRELLPALCDGRGDLAVGDPADFLLIEAATWCEALAERPAARRRFRAGREISLDLPSKDPTR